MTRSRWRMLLGIFAVLGVFSIAVACGDDDDEGDSAATQPAGGSPTQATNSGGAPKGTITIRAVQFENWDPHFSDFAQDISHFYMVNRGLYMLDLQNKPQPELADGMPKVSADGKVYTIKLKSGLKWSDGQPIKAEQFVAGIQRTCNPDVAGHYQFILDESIKGCHDYSAAGKEAADKKEQLRAAMGVKAIDDLTLEITLNQAQPTFTTILTMWPTFPTPTHKVAKVDDKWPGPMESAYTGPFMPSKYTEKNSLELVPNPNWSGAAKPKVEKIVLRYIDDPAVATQAYRAGEIDATVLPAAEFPAVKADSNLSKELNQFPATRTFGLAFNQRAGQVGEKMDLRLALSQAVDRDAMNQVVFKGVQTATTNWMPPDRSGLPLNAFKDQVGFNVTKAKESLSKAGYADGKGFPKLTLLLTDTTENKDLGAFLKDQWKKNLNIDVDLEFVDSKTRSTRYNTGAFQLVIAGWQEDYPDPENWYIGLRETGGSINKEGCSLPALDDLIKKAKVNTNDEERRKQYQEAEKLAVTNAQCNLPLWHVSALRLVKPYITGMKESKRAGDTFVMGDWNPENWATSKK